jgi:hypothetical protein
MDKPKTYPFKVMVQVDNEVRLFKRTHKRKEADHFAEGVQAGFELWMEYTTDHPKLERMDAWVEKED